MSGRIKRHPKSKSSIIYCSEKFACVGDQTEAEIECEECGSFQCRNCELQLHQNKHCIFHERKKLESPDLSKLCQSVSCDSKNFADIRCEECAFNYCFTCFDKTHSSGKRKHHKRVPFSMIKTFSSDPNSSLESASLEIFGDAVDFSETNNKPNEQLKDVHSTTCMPVNPISANNSGSYQSHTSTDGTDSLSLTYLSLPQEPYKLPVSKSDLSDKNNTNSMSSVTSRTSLSSLPDVAATISAELDELNLSSDIDNNIDDDLIFNDCKSILFFDQDENIKIEDHHELGRKLVCEPDKPVKVVSIFGNTGDGKSYTLNHTFFGGHEIFKTSSTQHSGTCGVWAAFDPVHDALVLDTEGLLGVSSNRNQRTRLLLKVLAISDVVIFRTRAERLHSDLFSFLGDASKAYFKHFNQELKAASERYRLNLPVSNMGPSVIIFHETLHTEILGKDSSDSADVIVKRRFEDEHISIEAFSSVRYVGTRTVSPPTDFKELLHSVKSQLKDTAVRTPRKLEVIFNALKVLNEKFIGDIEKPTPSTFPDQYFSCNSRCLACGARCTKTMNHIREGVDHHLDTKCVFKHEYENKIFTCQQCHNQGNEVVVVPKTASSKDNSWLALASYAWSGYVLECSNCGVIYRSRQHWYGNEDPVKTVVRTQIRHVWPDKNHVLQGTHNAARRLLDGIQYVSDSIVSVSAKPTKMATKWISDQVAPSYWVPNSQIQSCYGCRVKFTEEQSIHHCRGCGQGFCDECSSNKKPVPERGWGMEPVRVCDNCLNNSSSDMIDSCGSDDSNQVIKRKVVEGVASTVGAVASVVSYPIGVMKDSARPTYWKPDHQIDSCKVCASDFGPKLTIHHCRACGEGVCDKCSMSRRSVPSRGWDHKVRVCDICNKQSGRL